MLRPSLRLQTPRQAASLRLATANGIRCLWAAVISDCYPARLSPALASSAASGSQSTSPSPGDPDVPGLEARARPSVQHSAARSCQGALAPLERSPPSTSSAFRPQHATAGTLSVTCVVGSRCQDADMPKPEQHCSEPEANCSQPISNVLYIRLSTPHTLCGFNSALP